MSQSSFQEISASDFFYRNRDIAGFTNPSRSIFAAIRELVENLYKHLFTEVLNIKLDKFPILPYKESMDRYGCRQYILA